MVFWFVLSKKFGLGALAPQTLRFFGWGGALLNDHPQHLIEAAKRGLLDQMLFFFGAADDTGAADDRRSATTVRRPPATTQNPNTTRPQHRFCFRPTSGISNLYASI